MNIKIKESIKIPQTGITNTIIFVVAGIAIVGTVVFIRSRKMLK
ncbi:MAG TPA: hypothetical protein DCZ30_02895 [Clostridiales bacterium]|nr:hypothetical protein [Clostridiales bacterium]